MPPRPILSRLYKLQLVVADQLSFTFFQETPKNVALVTPVLKKPVDQAQLDWTMNLAVKDYPRMAECPGRFTAETEAEVLKHVELHASVAHGEAPPTWSDEDKTYLKRLVRFE